VIGTVNSLGDGVLEAIAEQIITDLLSGVQPMAVSYPGWAVSRLGTPPSAGMTNASRLWSYSPVNAIHFPSGENLGLLSDPGFEVRRAALPPDRGTDQRSPANSKTIVVALMVGERIRRGDKLELSAPS